MTKISDLSLTERKDYMSLATPLRPPFPFFGYSNDITSYTILPSTVRDKISVLLENSFRKYCNINTQFTNKIYFTYILMMKNCCLKTMIKTTTIRATDNHFGLSLKMFDQMFVVCMYICRYREGTGCGDCALLKLL